MTTKLFTEAVVVGGMTLAMSKFINLSNDKNIFMMGVIIHILCEYSGLNRYYCKHGNACIM